MNIQQTLRSEAINLLKQVNKSTFVHLLYEVEVQMRKTNNDYVGATKVVSGNFLIGNVYFKRVIKNGENEGISAETNTFEVEKPKGKTPISRCVLVKDDNPNIHYLAYEYFENTNVKVLEYRFNNTTIDKHLIESFMIVASKSNKQPQTNKVNWKTLGINNLKEMTLNGTKHILID